MRTVFLIFVCGLLGTGEALCQVDREDARHGAPEWEMDSIFPHDKFTFARIIYSSGGGGWGRRGGGGFWRTDYPGSDLNFSFRLQELTAMQVDPDGLTLPITDENFSNYPFVFMSDPRAIQFSDEEVVAFRRYLLNGGFLMVDDFWGDRMWAHFHSEMKRIFPDREPVELELSHPIFSCVFPLKQIPQVPSHDAAEEGRPFGRTWEPTGGESDEALRTPHFMAYFDDQQRMMVLACHNNDLEDGWEEENYKEWFFQEFSEKFSYPMGINILFYAMTH